MADTITTKADYPERVYVVRVVDEDDNDEEYFVLFSSLEEVMSGSNGKTEIVAVYKFAEMGEVAPHYVCKPPNA